MNYLMIFSDPVSFIFTLSVCWASDMMLEPSEYLLKDWLSLGHRRAENEPLFQLEKGEVSGKTIR